MFSNLILRFYLLAYSLNLLNIKLLIFWRPHFENPDFYTNNLFSKTICINRLQYLVLNFHLRAFQLQKPVQKSQK